MSYRKSRTTTIKEGTKVTHFLNTFFQFVMFSEVAGICVDVSSSAVLLLVLISCLSPWPCWMCGSVHCRFDI